MAEPRNSNDRQNDAVKAGPLPAVRRILAMPNDSTTKTMAVAVTLCLVCAVVVSASAVLLKPRQVENQVLDRQRNILQAAGRYNPDVPIEAQFEGIEPRIVNLGTGEYVGDIDVESYDQRAASRDPERSVGLPRYEDIAGIGRRANYAKVYLVMSENEVDKVILPVHGYGLWSTMYAFLALEEDGNTIFSLRVYEHAETPGLGGEVDNPRWRDQWEGKKVFDQQGEVEIQLAKGSVPPDHPQVEYRVDGLSGATLTARGVTNMLQYWLSDQGFGPYLDKLRQASG